MYNISISSKKLLQFPFASFAFSKKKWAGKITSHESFFFWSDSTHSRHLRQRLNLEVKKSRHTSNRKNTVGWKQKNSIWKNYFLWHLNGTEIQQVDDLTNRFIIQSFFFFSFHCSFCTFFLYFSFFLGKFTIWSLNNNNV